jgi:hypothetical protein
MPLYRAAGNIDHNFVHYKKGDVVELPEGEKSDLFVLVESVPVSVVVPLENIKAVVFDAEPTKRGKKSRADWPKGD